MMIDDETLQIYVEEAEEHLANIEKELLLIEEMAPGIDDNLVNKVFRAAHSIKGGAGFMGLNTVKELSHKLENVLGLIRDKELTPNSEIVNVLLSGFDRLKDLIDNISDSNSMDISTHVDSLNAISTGNLSSEDHQSISQTREIRTKKDGTVLFSISEYDLNQGRKGGKFIYLFEFDLIHDVHQKNKTPFDIINFLTNSGSLLGSFVDIMGVGTLESDESLNRLPFNILFATIIEPDLIADIIEIDEKYIFVLPEHPANAMPISLIDMKNSQQSLKQDASDKQQSTSDPIIKKTDHDTNATGQQASISKPVSPAKVSADNDKEKQTKEVDLGTSQKETSLRVNISLLDSLMNLAGELVLSRNQLLRSISSDDSQSLELSKQRIDIVTSELQEAIMLTRMQPIGKIFNKFPRVVRDLARQLGKEIKLILEGKDVELDKSIIEGLNDPLTHMIRNSVDHGIETPDIRRNNGKNESGEIILRAFHEAGHINIEIIDDGKGIDGEALSKKAFSKGLISNDQLVNMSDKDKVNLIFLPGFSTAEKVSDVSGRGVGMDVVKSNLDSMGGVVDISSVVGEGTTVRIKLPLTLAIIPSLLVSVNKIRYAIPQVNLDELLRIPANQIKQRIEIVGSAKVVRLRETLLPILSLAEVIGEKTEAQSEKKAVNIAVVSAGEFKYGLMVDDLHDSEEIVVKPLGRHLQFCKEYAGATILGDGRVALILDVVNLATRAQLNPVEVNALASENDVKSALKKSTDQDVESFLLFRSSCDEQFAVPLNLVARIERIQEVSMEKLGQRQVMQYMGGSIPLFCMHEVATVKPIEKMKNYIVIVFMISGKEFGLLANGPLDSLEIPIHIDDRIFKQPGILGSMVIQDHTTLIVDIYGFIKTIHPQWIVQETQEDDEPTILLAEDAAFFRNQMKQILEDEGFQVIMGEDGVEAWNLLETHHEEISIVLTDIEMPNMNGFELTRKIKKDPRFNSIPVIAVTSLSEEKHRIEGKKAGVDDYQIKLDRPKLIASIKECLHHS